MKLESAIIDEICEVIRVSGAVPMPGGHGVWFADVRSCFADLPTALGVEARCYVCISLLGDGEGEQRWNPKEWWPHALAWFDIYCPEIADRLDAPRWGYLLRAMFTVAKRWCDADVELRHLIPYVTDCWRRAEERVRQITRTAKPGASLASLLAASGAVEISVPDERWDTAVSELSGARADAVEMLYFMHVLHSTLGVAQHSMDQRYSTRMPFYGQLQAILEGGWGMPQSLLGPAARIAATMGRTALLGQVGQPSASLDALSGVLPSCFQPASAGSTAPSRIITALRLQSAPAARDRMLAAHDLAVLTADLAMDIFRSGGVDGPAFRVSAFDYLHSLVRYGPKIADGRQYGELRPTTVDQWSLTGRPMTRSFSERMRSGLLVVPARERCSIDLGITISATTLATKPIPQIETGLP